MSAESSIVKLVPNASVKTLLQEAKRVMHDIEVDEQSFMVRDKDNKCIIFKGIKIRNNLWGLTFTKN